MTNCLSDNIPLKTIKVKRKAKKRNSYNHVPHLIPDIIWENDKTQGNITHKSATTRLQGTQTKQDSIIKTNVKHK